MEPPDAIGAAPLRVPSAQRRTRCCRGGGIVYGDPAPSIQVASELSVLLSLDASYDEVSRGRPIAIKVALCKAARSRE
jgi:hypothetical protein